MLQQVKELKECGPIIHVFAMATGDLGDLGPPAPEHVEQEGSHAVAPVTTQPQTMEGDRVLEVVQPAKSAIHSAVLLMVSGVDGVHGHPAKEAYMHVEMVKKQEQEGAPKLHVVVQVPVLGVFPTHKLLMVVLKPKVVTWDVAAVEGIIVVMIAMAGVRDVAMARDGVEVIVTASATPLLGEEEDVAPTIVMAWDIREGIGKPSSAPFLRPTRFLVKIVAIEKCTILMCSCVPVWDFWRETHAEFAIFSHFHLHFCLVFCDSQYK